MEWELYGNSGKVCANINHTVMAARSINDFHDKFKPVKFLENPEQCAVIERIGGEDRITKTQLIKMRSNEGLISYFDSSLVEEFEKEISKLYLPYVEPKVPFGVSDSPLFMIEEDVIYVIMPFVTETFIEVQTLDDWL